MHFAERSYLLIILTAVLGIAGTWSSERDLTGIWHWPAILLLIGLAWESAWVRRAVLRAQLETRPRAHLGREQTAAFAFHNDSARDLKIEFAPVMPPGFEPLTETRRVSVPRGATARDIFTLKPIRLGPQSWTTLPARLLGPLGLAWWPRELPAQREIAVAPDTLRVARLRPRGSAAGARPQRAMGAGAELFQLRPYVPGDPLARIDWKASARSGALASREFSEDQHLDILVAIDAGRYSRIRGRGLDRLGLHANIAAHFAEVATPNDDRVGLVVFADRPLLVCAPARGLPAIRRLHAALEQLRVAPVESDPIAAALRIRTLLKHRSLVILLTDLDDAAAADPLSRAVRLLSPPHLVVVAGVLNPEIEEFARHESRDWLDPWLALAALEHREQSRSRRQQLQRLGAPVIAAREENLEQAIFAEYETLRRSRRV